MVFDVARSIFGRENRTRVVDLQIESKTNECYVDLFVCAIANTNYFQRHLSLWKKFVTRYKIVAYCLISNEVNETNKFYFRSVDTA